MLDNAIELTDANSGLDIFYVLYIILCMIRYRQRTNKEVHEKINCDIFSYLQRLWTMAAKRRDLIAQGNSGQ